MNGQHEAGRRHLDESGTILETLASPPDSAGVPASHPGPDVLELAVRENIVLSGLARNEGEYLQALT